MGAVFDRFFRHAPDIVSPEKEQLPKEFVDQASEWLVFTRMSGYERLMSFLEKEADRPVPVRPDVAEMISGITRQATLKEVRDQLRRWSAEARDVMTFNREVDNG